MYSQDFRKQVLLTLKKGYSLRQVASDFNISKTTIQNWKRNFVPKDNKAGRPEVIDSKALLRDIEVDPDAYQYERAERFGCSRSGMSRCLKRLNISKKNSQTS